MLTRILVVEVLGFKAKHRALSNSCIRNYMKAGGNCIPSKPDLKLSRSVACATAAGR
jgi:hypothetical protein